MTTKTMTLELFRATYPEFAQSATDEQINSKLRLANLLIGKLGSFEGIEQDAIGLLTAHLLVLHKKGGLVGNSIQTKTSKKVGDVQVNLQTEQGSRAWYALSNYGQQLLMFIDLEPKYGGAFVAAGLPQSFYFQQ